MPIICFVYTAMKKEEGRLGLKEEEVRGGDEEGVEDDCPADGQQAAGSRPALHVTPAGVTDMCTNINSPNPT